MQLRMTALAWGPCPTKTLLSPTLSACSGFSASIRSKVFRDAVQAQMSQRPAMEEKPDHGYEQPRGAGDDTDLPRWPLRPAAEQRHQKNRVRRPEGSKDSPEDLILIRP
jgi:hypothetical protein